MGVEATDGSAVHPNLVNLQEVEKTLSYSGWERDFRDALDAHKERGYATDFPKVLRKLKVKQKLHDGDRSHPRLVAMDAIVKKGGLTYPGWQADVRQLEKMHCEVPYLARSDIGFNSRLRGLQMSQLMHQQQELDQAKVVANNHEDAPRRTTTDTSQSTAATAQESIDDKPSASNLLGDCTICGDVTKSHAFVPCGHLCVCEECSSKVMRRNPRCPVCRCSAIETLQIFL